MDSADPRVFIVGAGAVGCFIGARLALAGMPVTLIGRPALVEVALRHGLTLTTPEGRQETGPLSAATSLAEVSLRGWQDLAVVTTKAYDTAAVVSQLKAVAPTPLQAPTLLSLQNGIGNEEAFRDAYNASKVLAGAIETPLSMPEPGRIVVHRPRYNIGVAPMTARMRADAAVEVLQRAGFPVTLYDDYRRLKWSKLLLNLPANASCAILDWTPAQVMADPATAELEARGWQEAFRVMRAQGIAPVSLAGYPLPALAPLVTRIPPSLLARGLARTVAGGRGSKSPSLREAMSAGKRSEVAWLNGAVAAAGERLGIPTPVNRALTDVLSALSQRREHWADWRHQPQRLTILIPKAT